MSHGDEDGRITRVQELAVAEFRRAGIAGQVVEDPTDVLNTSIQLDEGSVYGLANLTISCLNSSRLRWRGLIRAHVQAIVASRSTARDSTDLSVPAQRRQLRARLLPVAAVPSFVTYGRPYAPDLVEVLCLDLPHTVSTIDDAAVAGHDLDELFSLGRSQLALEEPGERSTVAEGIVSVEGDSFFTGSQVLNPEFLRRELTASPLGFVFLVPYRHAVFLAPVTGPESIAAVSTLANFTLRMDPDEFVGGLLSRWLYFTDGEVVERITDIDEESGELRILGDGAFLEAINR